MPNVTVIVPAIGTEKLSSKDRSRGIKARQGWIRHVTSTDRTKRGGYMLVNDAGQPFLTPGERQLPVGAVIAFCDWDDAVKLGTVQSDGSIAWVTEPTEKITYPSGTYNNELGRWEYGTDTEGNALLVAPRIVTYEPRNVWTNLKTATITLCDRIDALLMPSAPTVDARDAAIAEIRRLMAEHNIKIGELADIEPLRQAISGAQHLAAVLLRTPAKDSLLDIGRIDRAIGQAAAVLVAW